MQLFDPRINPRVFHNWRHCLAFGLGSGLARRAPGTWGTLAAVPFCVLLWWWLPAWGLAVVMALLAVAGVVLCGSVAHDLGVHDHGGIVWDEWVGYGISLVALPHVWFAPLAAFVMFRALDILKPWPISWCDKHLQGGLGIMLDDVLAGVFSCLILQLVWHGVIV